MSVARTKSDPYGDTIFRTHRVSPTEVTEPLDIKKTLLHKDYDNDMS